MRAIGLSARISKDNPFRQDSEQHFGENGARDGGTAKNMDPELRRALAWKALGVGVLVAGVVLGASLCRGAEKKRASTTRISSNRPLSNADRLSTTPFSYRQLATDSLACMLRTLDAR